MRLRTTGERAVTQDNLVIGDLESGRQKRFSLFQYVMEIQGKDASVFRKGESEIDPRPLLRRCF